ncbi:MAG TPA: hypothetical protein VGR26_16675 [Acidimicrobiales bacterium]|nr:hypothetical protein [Acidimicrobiales bacterium]
MTVRASLLELLLPRRDAGAGIQVVVAVALFSAAAVAARHNRDLLWLVAGLGTVTFAWFGLRTLH